MPSRPSAFVASSALRNCGAKGGQQKSAIKAGVDTHLDESVVLLVTQVHRDDRLVTLQPETLQVLAEVSVAQEPALGHLRVEELPDALLGRLHADVSDIQTARLTRLRADGRARANCTEDGRAVEEGRVVAAFDTGRKVRLRVTGKVEHA